MEAILLYCLTVFFAFFLINHADVLSKPRNALAPLVPSWMKYPLKCALCFTFWTTSALSLFWGFTPVIFYAPPLVMFMDLIFQRLK